MPHSGGHIEDLLEQQFPTLWAPGTGFVKDNFSTDPVWVRGRGWGDSGGFKPVTFKLISCCGAGFLTGTDRSGTTVLKDLLTKPFPAARAHFLFIL